MKMIKKCFVALLIVGVILSCFIMTNSSATIYSEYGMQVTVTSGKASYTPTDDMKISIDIKNKGDANLNNLLIKCVLPEGFKYSETNTEPAERIVNINKNDNLAIVYFITMGSGSNNTQNLTVTAPEGQISKEWNIEHPVKVKNGASVVEYKFKLNITYSLTQNELFGVDLSKYSYDDTTSAYSPENYENTLAGKFLFTESDVASFTYKITELTNNTVIKEGTLATTAAWTIDGLNYALGKNDVELNVTTKSGTVYKYNFTVRNLHLDNAGGFNFYSLTLHYDAPLLLSYTYILPQQAEDLGYDFDGDGNCKEEGWIFGEVSQDSNKYVLKAGNKGGAEADAYIIYGEKPAAQSGGNFVALTTADDANDMRYGIIPDSYAFITNIQDGDIIESQNQIFFRGIVDTYDDLGKQNPNLTYDADGYAIGTEQYQDASGNMVNYRIDKNGFYIDKDGNWFSAYQGITKKVELYKLISKRGETIEENLEVVNRFDENGKIIKLEKGKNYLMYLVEADGKIVRDKKNQMITGTPKIGIPQMKAKFTNMTVELDAYGDQIYNEADWTTSDPQYKNIMYITFDTNYKNYLTSKDNAAKDKWGTILDPTEVVGTYVGLVHSKTTKTTLSTDENNFQNTAVSVNVELAEGMTYDQLPLSSRFTFEFHIETTQPDAGKYPLSAVPKGNVVTEKIRADIESKPFPLPEFTGLQKFFNSLGLLKKIEAQWGVENGPMYALYILIGTASAIVLIVVLILVSRAISKSKKRKKALAANSLETTSETTVSETELTAVTKEEVIKETETKETDEIKE